MSRDITGTVEAAADHHEWDSASLREQWIEHSREVGRASQAHLQALLDTVPGSMSSSLTTADGFNLCSIGLSEDSVDRIAALGSSLHSIANAGVVALPFLERNVDTPDSVVVQAGDVTMIYLTFTHGSLGSLILTLTAENSVLGEMLMEARLTLSALENALVDV